MTQRSTLLHFSPLGQTAPDSVQRFAAQNDFEIVEVGSAETVLARVSRAYPGALIVDGSFPSEQALDLCRQIKDEAFTSVFPVIVYIEAGGAEAAARALEAGADEVLTQGTPPRESHLRLGLALRRAERDVSVHPTTRLPGTIQIERDFAERLSSGETFAVCYADIDHFKEFNDRYGYHNGDRVILLTSKILRDVVRARAPSGFVGHIGGDDFIFSVPMEKMQICCAEILELFDTLMPYQYTEEDRDRGWFRGKDRRGNAYDVPLMSLSIGVVTNKRRSLSHTAEISELAAEMKAYAKSFKGSLFVVDRRDGEAFADNAESESEEAVEEA